MLHVHGYNFCYRPWTSGGQEHPFTFLDPIIFTKGSIRVEWIQSIYNPSMWNFEEPSKNFEH